MVQAQLLLVTTDPTWRIDSSTRRIGRAGLAQARAALAAANHTGPIPDPIAVPILATASATATTSAPATHEHTLAA